MAGNNGGPWGGGGNRGGGDDQGGSNGSGNGGGGGRKPGGDSPQIPEIDELMKKGQEQLRVLMGGRGGGSNNNGTGGGGVGGGFSKGTFGLIALGAIALWLFQSFYTVKPEEQSVELFLGEYSATGGPGLNFAPWPVVTAEVLPVTREQTEDIGVGGRGESGLMLTTDENIVDVDFQVVWNINDPAKYLFNLAAPRETIRAVSESAMREVIARSELAPILNRDRQSIADTTLELIQNTMNQYDSGVNIVRLNLDKADPPREVIDSFREVQAAEQKRDTLQRQADTYANRKLAGARGEAAQLLEQAEAYRAQQVNQAEGEASRFSAILEEYNKAPDVTRKRLWLETVERVYGGANKIILDSSTDGGGQGVVQYLPLNELIRSGTSNSGTSNTGGSN
ncbi:protease FtsH subunit HflK [Litoreibacter halocynthiae]|uniref:Protein HflK n=1 Tax=Litoreibacter halocynthiae TaxID=1242689 RepID=A0A4V3EX24_9RHOB|nr:FtsH protease activity modulator HflK [Litoreibacter halocynthiae]TDT74825.1 protease FtsH subunit HflK [Litoreibacter halocynthiae]